MEIVQFGQSIGPLMNIVMKMSADFLYFLILYAILLIMFAVVGLIMFIPELPQYATMFESAMAVLDASIGNFNFDEFRGINNNDFLVGFGSIYTIIIVVVFNILILNLLIAILANTYQMFNTKATGLYLSKILISRSEMMFDSSYGSFLLTLIPINFFMVPLVPFAMCCKPSEKVNRILIIFQY